MVAIFSANYYLQFELKDENYSQPTVLDEDFNTVVSDLNFLPATLPLMSSKEKLKCRKIKQILRYRRAPNIYLYPEEYAHNMLFLFAPSLRAGVGRCRNNKTAGAIMQNMSMVDFTDL